MSEWFTNDRFWQLLYPYMFDADRLATTQQEVDGILALGAPAGRRVLDLCSGPGRHAVELARRGYAVTGVDRSLFLMERARERAAAAGVAVEWVQADMREFERPESFDLAINMFSSIGYFENDRENSRPLQMLHRNLAPGGAALIELIAKEQLAKVLTNTSSAEYPDGSILVQRHWVQDNWQRIRNQWILIRDETAQYFTFDHQLYSGVELRDRLLAVGFRDVRLYGNLQGDAMGPQTTRLVAVATKQEQLAACPLP